MDALLTIRHRFERTLDASRHATIRVNDIARLDRHASNACPGADHLTRA
jgi:hypothetical protein